MKVEVSCVLCTESATVEVPTPEGWAISGDEEVYADNELCPKHAAIAGFRRAQCPGCVASFDQSCPLFKAFAYQHRRTITKRDFEVLEAGKCPRRVNGTSMTTASGGIRPIDISDPAPPEAGKAMADAIREYVERYPS